MTSWHRLDLPGLTGTLVVNGERAGHGRGRDILGHPLDALAWLANHSLPRGGGLRAGEFVLLGSLVTTQWLQAGDEVVVEVESLGGVSARFP